MGRQSASVSLTDVEVHLWTISLGSPSEKVRRLPGMLCEEEEARAARYVIPQHGDRFRLCRAAVRDILARYAGCSGQQVKFRSTEGGKPYLDDSMQVPWLRFNVTHSQDLAVLAVCLHREIGVDVEALRPMNHLDAMISRCLGPEEQRSFRAEGTGRDAERFLRYWTHKEAYLKAVGAGLRFPLKCVEFDLSAGGSQRLLRGPVREERFHGMYIAEFVPGAGYCGAVALERTAPVQLDLRAWSVPE